MIASILLTYRMQSSSIYLSQAALEAGTAQFLLRLHPSAVELLRSDISTDSELANRRNSSNSSIATMLFCQRLMNLSPPKSHHAVASPKQMSISCRGVLINTSTPRHRDLTISYPSRYRRGGDCSNRIRSGQRNCGTQSTE